MTTPGIDLAAPCGVRGYFTTGTNNYSFTRFCGTSHAAPAVSAGVALLRQVLQDRGWNSVLNNARYLMTQAMVFGDGSDGSSSGTSAQVNSLVGYGRARYQAPFTGSLTAPWSWAARTAVVPQGQTYTVTINNGNPLGTSFAQYKIVMAFFNNVVASDIVLEVVDTCPPGGGTQVIGSDWSFNLRKRVYLTGSQFHNRCLEARAIALETPSQGKRVYMALMRHSGWPM